MIWKPLHSILNTRVENNEDLNVCAKGIFPGTDKSFWCMSTQVESDEMDSNGNKKKRKFNIQTIDPKNATNIVNFFILS